MRPGVPLHDKVILRFPVTNKSRAALFPGSPTPLASPGHDGTFLDDLCAGYAINRVRASRNVNSVVSKRG